ncbi:ras-related protein Rab-26 isoform X2 [Marmota flaviventris]|uniref:ras-related protein Rab-26 isoform X2 n=1 Tax=Marmota flaviventris TaxID=93162 RepID=UPI003A88EECB
MSRKKTPKCKGGSVPAASALPAANGPRPVRPGTTHPGPEAPPNGPPQFGRPSLGGGGDFYDVAFKVMLVGDSGVGKTCLLVRFKDGAFLAGTFISTVGIDFRNKVLDVDGVKVKLQIWDTAGQERFRSVTHAYYRDAHALLLLYDVTNKASFDNIQDSLDKALVRWAPLPNEWELFGNGQSTRCGLEGPSFQKGKVCKEHQPPALPTGLADRDPGVCPAQRGAHAAGEQGGQPALYSL